MSGIQNAGFRNDNDNPQVSVFLLQNKSWTRFSHEDFRLQLYTMATISELPQLESVDYANVADLPRERHPNKKLSEDTEQPIYDTVAKPSESFIEKYDTKIRMAKTILLNVVIVAYFIWATVHYFDQSRSNFSK